MTDRSEDGTSLVNVQSGEGLGETLDQLFQRSPAVREAVWDRPKLIKFLNASEGVVWFVAPVAGLREGRALVVNGKWKVSRATYCSLVGMAGVVCPSPPES